MSNKIATTPIIAVRLANLRTEQKLTQTELASLLSEVLGRSFSFMAVSYTHLCIFIGKRYHGPHYVKAGIINELGVIQSFNFTKENKIPILLALMPLFLEDEETKQIYDSMSDYLEWDVDLSLIHI